MATCLNATLLVRHPENGQVLVNFDSRILELFREIQCFQTLGLEVPALGKILFGRKDTIISNYQSLQVRM